MYNNNDEDSITSGEKTILEEIKTNSINLNQNNRQTIQNIDENDFQVQDQKINC